jgi:hypothetical protein
MKFGAGAPAPAAPNCWGSLRLQLRNIEVRYTIDWSYWFVFLQYVDAFFYSFDPNSVQIRGFLHQR